ncbi:MAG: hypothetical protein GF328_03435, partial [Candidatus Latescibacteria bacterium]|nr:hypothetical protein [Candidatus Latescibacterota bacterium]
MRSRGRIGGAAGILLGVVAALAPPAACGEEPFADLFGETRRIVALPRPIDRSGSPGVAARVES